VERVGLRPHERALKPRGPLARRCNNPYGCAGTGAWALIINGRKTAYVRRDGTELFGVRKGGKRNAWVCVRRARVHASVHYEVSRN